MFDMTSDNSRTRVFELENGNKLYAKQTDPYGFWYLNLDKGQMPEEFTGAYNTFDQVKVAVEKYSARRKVAAKAVDVSRAK